MKSRNMDTPSLTSDFSVLEMVDNVTNMKHFQVTDFRKACTFTIQCKGGHCLPLMGNLSLVKY